MPSLPTPQGLPPRPRVPTRLPTGPKRYRGGREVVAGPGEPPPGFVRPTTSKTEWFVYWALWKIFGTPRDAREGPFFGGPPFWAYQEGTGGDGTRSKPDFTVYRPRRLIIRVQTEFRHLFTDNAKQAYDRLQRVAQSNHNTVVDLYDFRFINDKTGQAVIIETKAAIGLIERPDPIVAGTALRGSRQDQKP
jgi:hypothetical protein